MGIYASEGMFGGKEREDWKGKYRDLLSEFEERQGELETQRDSLRQLAVRLAITGMGRDERVDAALETIVDGLRSEAAADELRETLGDLSSAVAAHEQQLDDGGQADLGVFVAELPLPPDERSRFLDALGRDGGAPRADTLSALAAQLHHIVDALEADRDELQTFIEEVTRQLDQFEAWTRSSEDDSRARREDAATLDAGVERQFDDLQREIEHAGEVGELKDRVRSRLATVARQLRDYRERETRRAEESDRRNAALREELDRMRVRTSELARQVGEQEERLMHDVLTGVHTRYAYDRRLQEEFQRWLRHGQPLSFAIWDIDHFKKVNDTWGHDAGDRLLKIVAGILAQQTRMEDFVARVGGEEFVVLFPATGLEAAFDLAERLRGAIASAAIHYQGTPIEVTASCGLTEFREGDTPEVVYRRADAALYQAKRSGRDRCIADVEETPPAATG